MTVHDINPTKERTPTLSRCFMFTRDDERSHKAPIAGVLPGVTHGSFWENDITGHVVSCVGQMRTPRKPFAYYLFIPANLTELTASLILKDFGFDLELTQGIEMPPELSATRGYYEVIGKGSN